MDNVNLDNVDNRDFIDMYFDWDEEVRITEYIEDRSVLDTYEMYEDADHEFIVYYHEFVN